MQKLTVLLVMAIAVIFVTPAISETGIPTELSGNGLRDYDKWKRPGEDSNIWETQELLTNTAWGERFILNSNAKIIMIYFKDMTHYMMGRPDKVKDTDVLIDLAKMKEIRFFAAVKDNPFYNLLNDHFQYFGEITILGDEWHVFHAKKKTAQTDPTTKIPTTE